MRILFTVNVYKYSYLSKKRFKSGSIKWCETDDLLGGLEVFFNRKQKLAQLWIFAKFLLFLVFVNGIEIYLLKKLSYEIDFQKF